jgi:hypothetical protein
MTKKQARKQRQLLIKRGKGLNFNPTGKVYSGDEFLAGLMAMMGDVVIVQGRERKIEKVYTSESFK